VAEALKNPRDDRREGKLNGIETALTPGELIVRGIKSLGGVEGVGGQGL
jgi:hypothetical protein